MWIVSLALRRPYTFIVLALLIALLGVFTILRTPTDIFPNINIPVVATVWRYTGLSPEEMATRLVLGSERGAQTTVNDVEHTESQSLSGIGGGEVLLPAECQRGAVLRADHRHLSDRLGRHASRYDPAVRARLQRLDGAGPAARPIERSSIRGADLRLGQQHHSHGACHGRRRIDALAVRRPATPSSGRPRPRRAARTRPVRQRRYRSRSPRRT